MIPKIENQIEKRETKEIFYPTIRSRCMAYFAIREIETSENKWNRWIREYDENGKLMLSEFETGGYWRAIQHLLICRKCRKLTHITKREVIRIEREISRLWKEAT